jgi:DNA-binding NtrC family response regulator
MASDEFDDRSTVHQRRFDPSPPSDEAFVLAAEAGPDRGTRLLVHAADPPALVGTSAVCALRLSDREVSRRHLAVEVRGAELHLVDLGSTNGTFVERVRVEAALLRGGEAIQLGSTLLRAARAPTAGRAVSLDVSFGRVLGASREMRRLYPICERLAQSDVPVVIEGETGAGKELLAEALHERSRRVAGPFVAVDASALAAQSGDLELFGAEATPGAPLRPGAFEQAHGGTLFIHAVSELDAQLQAKLLRAVERGEIRRVGGTSPMRVDVRLLVSSRRDLDREVQEGRFRDDLYHRLAVARVALPPLRERRGDVALLAEHFWRALGGDERALVPELLSRWETQPWPGNVRELRNAVARQLALGDAGELPPAASAGPIGGDFLDRVVATGGPLVRGRGLVVEEYERRYVARVLAENGGNVVHAARASGIARRHFQRIKARVKR